MADWQNRIIGLRVVKASELADNPNNWRKHPKRQLTALGEVLSKVGMVSPLIYNITTKRLLDGHARKGLNPDALVPVVDVELSEDEERLVLATLDPLANMAETDGAMLKALLEGFAGDDAVSALVSAVAEDNRVQLGGGGDMPDPVAQVDKAKELQAEWKTERGQVWLVGGVHRVMCGDSTNADDVARLMDGKRADCVITDPPYGVDYSEKNRFLNAISPANRIQKPIENDGGDKSDIQTMWKSAFACMSDVMRKGAVVYCFMPQGGDQMMMMMMGAGIEPRHELIWLKNNHVLGRVDYAYKHEPILYAWKDTGHKFYGDFQTSVIEIPKPQRSDLHPTMKPVELINILVKNSSLAGEIVYDLFLGSGTTLIACAQTGRMCYGMEISPEYVAVILQRAVDAGLKCQLLT